MNSFKVVCGVVSVVAFGMAGCNDGKKVEVIPVTGMVLIDEKPISGVALTLVPQAGVQGRGGYATSAVDGTFELLAEPDVKGVAPGNYRVLFQKYAMPDGSPVPPGTSWADANLINQLPALYSHPEQSPIYATIPTGDGQGLMFRLSSRPR